MLSLLAPTDEVMKRLTVEQLEKLREDKEFRELVISKHGVAAPNWPFTNHVVSDFGTGLPLNRGPDGVLHVGPLPITQCDIMATNGVVHAVNGVRVNPGLNRRNGQQNLSMRSPHNPNVQVKIFGL
ncbi:hypothetical protein B566_EDAN007522 [Ephemera danica]|nr:hypothetical protein B566_EDAN007522 [Ephemera danica]